MEMRVDIDADEYSKVLKGRQAHGVTTQLSSYDIPKVIGVESKDGDLHLYFEYVDNESEMLQTLHSGVRVKIGKHSGKVLGLEVDRDHDTVPQQLAKFISALAHLIHNAKRFNQKANYELAKAVFEKTVDPILAKSSTPR